MALIHVMSAIRQRRAVLRVADWLLALAALGMAVWTGSLWWWAGAILGIVLAIAAPFDRILAQWPQVVRRAPRKPKV